MPVSTRLILDSIGPAVPFAGVTLAYCIVPYPLTHDQSESLESQLRRKNRFHWLTETGARLRCRTVKCTIRFVRRVVGPVFNDVETRSLYGHVYILGMHIVNAITRARTIGYAFSKLPTARTNDVDTMTIDRIQFPSTTSTRIYQQWAPEGPFPSATTVHCLFRCTISRTDQER